MHHNDHPHVLSVGGSASYAPANHTGTANQRIIGKDTVGARHIEVRIGTITKGSGSLRHAHPNLEQATFLLQGGGDNEVGGVVDQLGAGQWSLKPRGMFHRFDVTSEEPMKVIVIYSPPYGENPREAVRFEPGNPQPDPPAFVPLPGADEVACPRPGIRFTPVFTPKLSGDRHLCIHNASGDAGAGIGSGTLVGRERVLYVRQGGIAGSVQGRALRATAGQFVFVPEGAEWDLRCDDGASGCDFLLIDACPDAAQPLLG